MRKPWVGSTDKYGRFIVDLSEANTPSVGTILSITAMDAAGNISSPATIAAIDGGNIAKNKAYLTNANNSGSPNMALNGIISNTSDKWCTNSSTGGVYWLRVDLGASYTLNRWVVRHAGAGGDSPVYNTRNFKLQVSQDDYTWVDADIVTDNAINVTNRVLTGINARFARLCITTPSQSSDSFVRIFEFEVYGTANPIAPATTAVAVNPVSTTDTVISGTAEAGSTIRIVNANGILIGIGQSDSGGNYNIGIDITNTPAAGESISVSAIAAMKSESNAVAVTVIDGGNIAKNKTATANNYYAADSMPIFAVDSNISTFWLSTSRTNGVFWYQINLGGLYDVNRWILRHHTAVSGQDARYNMQDFKLQSSTDNVNWVDFDYVNGNSSNVTNRVITPTAMRYVRVLVTKASQIYDQARIRELELYGSKHAIIDTTPPDVPTVKMIIARDTMIQGTAEKFVAVSVAFPGGLTTTAIAGEDGAWSIPTTSQQQAVMSAGSNVTVGAIDESGNRSQLATIGILPNLALNRPATANAYNDQQQDSSRAVNGIVSDKWCSVSPISGTQQHWLLVDLGSTKKVSRWRVWHAESGSSGDTAKHNTTDFKLQGSTDGAVFFDMDSVTGNAIKLTDRTFAENMIRYARLYITDPSVADAYARIQEFELYGDINSTNDTVAPALPVLNTVYNYSTTISGTAETGASIIVQNINGNTIGAGSADNNGKFVVNFSEQNTPCAGSMLLVKAMDAAGNISNFASIAAIDGGNIAKNKTATANNYYAADSTPTFAVDSNTSTFWLSTSRTNGVFWYQINLGGLYDINRWIVRHHTAVSGQDLRYNMQDFKLQGSVDNINWFDVDAVTGNTANVTNREINKTTMQYVRVLVTKASQIYDQARIRELELYGSGHTEATVDSKKTVSCTVGKDVYIPFSVKNAVNLNNMTFKLVYSDKDLEVVDLISQTKALETKVGLASGDGIEIISFAPGEIVFKIKKAITNEKNWSGVINIIHFKAKITGKTNVTAEFQ